MRIKTDSRRVEPGDTFVAIRGVNQDGHDFINDAIERGATLIVAENGSFDVDTIIVEDSHEYLVNYLENTYKDILKEMKFIGITGTNGKTTSCYMIYSGLNKLGIKCGYIGTIGFFMDEKIKDLNNTTPDILELYEMILECYKNKYYYIVMEVSSHALAMHRVDGLLFDYAVFTNLTQDHLDYHQNMENYALAKKKLFNKIKKGGYAVVNTDDNYSNDFIFDKNNNITYGFNKADYQIESYKLTDTGMQFIINNQEYNTELLGKYNIYNMTVMIIVLNLIGISLDEIRKVLPSIKAPMGRMEKIEYNNNTIIIDYAHTPDAVEKIILATKEFCKGKIYTIIGCGGGRDKTKRYKMGEVATTLSDYVIFTSDNPRNEKPEDIVNDMLQNVYKNNYEIEINRKEAIKKGIQKLIESDILLVLGKGHENYQIIGNEKIYFSDRDEILDIL